jgi:hypothetical protein
MRPRLRLVSLLAVVSTTAYADLFDCTNNAARRVSATTAGVSRIVVVGRAGSLRVAGRAGVTEVVANGTACSSDRDDLRDIQLTAQRDGADLRIEAVIPDKLTWSFNQARLDFDVTVPSGVAVSIVDGSGSTEVTGVGALSVVDGSGSLIIRGVQGNAGVRDGSGSLDISDVTGSVTVNDGSGSIEIAHVGGSVVIESDGSGGVSVDDVRGGFEVRRKGSGGIDYERIGGSVSVPQRHRHRN